jgi:hypothetical protein
MDQKIQSRRQLCHVTVLQDYPDCQTLEKATLRQNLVKDRIRLWKEGVRDLVMELCCALHNFRVRLTPWQPMV